MRLVRLCWDVDKKSEKMIERAKKGKNVIRPFQVYTFFTVLRINTAEYIKLSVFMMIKNYSFMF